jgi:RNA polymerase primary sigma factor
MGDRPGHSIAGHDASRVRREQSAHAVRDLQLVRAARGGDGASREQLIVSHLGLVQAVAARYRGLGMPFDDLVQEGSLGLLDAIDRYDAARGHEFDAFARFRVRRSILNGLTEQARLVRLPKQVVERRRALARAEASLTTASGCAPTPAELAALTGLSPLALTKLRTAAIAPVSLEEPATADGSPLASLVADETARDPEREVLCAEAALQMRDAVARLSPRRREIIRRHFGLDDREASIATLARELHLSERRTRTIENDALHELALVLDPAL